MKKIFSVAVCLLVSAFMASAQYETEFTITDLDNTSLTVSIEQTLTRLVTELNTAHDLERLPDLAGMNLDSRTRSSILLLWENSPFRCTDTEIVEAALNTINGEYEVRNIPFIFSLLEKGDQYHEAAVTFDRKGTLTSFHISVSQNLYKQVMLTGNVVSDFRRRQMILDYVEQFRTAYNIKDMEFLNNVFSDDALIITGHVTKVKPNDSNRFTGQKITYSQQDKKTYLARLATVFAANKRIRVTFDDITVVRHPTDPNWYGVTLQQGYSSDNYSDDGWLFLLWDFSIETAPVIHVRTWQPDKDAFGNDLREEDIFGIDDVNI